MSGIEVEAIESEPKQRRHRGYKVMKNGRIIRTFQTDGEAHGLAAKMEADQIEAGRIKTGDEEADCDEADIADLEDEAYSPGPKL